MYTGPSSPPIAIHNTSSISNQLESAKFFTFCKEISWNEASENIMRENVSFPENGKGFVNDKVLQIHERWYGHSCLY